jgi:hypothetical protein
MVGTCPLCGARIDGGEDACRNIYFGEVLARESSSPGTYGAVHLLTVDCYALQHSEAHSPRSNALHLLRLCWVLFCNGDPDIMQKEKGPFPFIMQKYYREFPELTAPPAGERGSMTVLDVYRAKDPEEHKALSYAWGRSVWDAYAAHHAWVREMLANAGVKAEF